MGLKRQFMKGKTSSRIISSLWTISEEVAMQKGQIHHHQGKLGISLTMECTTPANQVKSVLFLTAVQNIKEDQSTRNPYQD